MSTKSWKTWWIDRKGMRANHCSRLNQVRGLPRTRLTQMRVQMGALATQPYTVHATKAGRRLSAYCLTRKRTRRSRTNLAEPRYISLLRLAMTKLPLISSALVPVRLLWTSMGAGRLPRGLANGPSRRQRASSWRTGIKISKTRPQRAHRSSTMHQWSRWRCRMSAQGAYACPHDARI